MMEPHSDVILLIEDDANMRELLNYNLSEAGYTVVEAQDGKQGLEKLANEPPDLVLCDVMMPVMNGFALREAMVADPATRDIPFIFLTAKSSAEDQVRGLQTGVDEYITKPFDIDVLLARIEAVLQRRENFARLASMDSLTELLNRQATERAIRRELGRIRRYPALATLMFLDIDNFKGLNDEYGHALGDKVLVHLAEIFLDQSRAVDIVGRYGGEEFLLFFPQTPISEATAVVSRMLERFRTPMDELPEVSLSFSAGAVEVPRDGVEFEELRDRADAAMYHVKRSGKGRIEAWQESMEMRANGNGGG